MRCALSIKSTEFMETGGNRSGSDIQSYDVIRTVEEFVKNPWPSKVYNLGGGRGDKVAIVEADITIEEMTQEKAAPALS